MVNDIVELTTNQMIELFRKAQAEAINRGIKANTVIINKNMAYVSPVFDGRHVLPEMICGMNVYWTADELPDGYSFAMMEAPNNRMDRLAQFEEIGMEPHELKKAAELYRFMKENM